MLNEDNKINYIEYEKNPMKIYEISNSGSFACRRPVGEGYYDEKSNKTYISWNEKGMDIYIATYDHKSNTWSDKELVWENNMFGRWDYHNYITMIPGENGEPILFYAVHSKHIYQINKDKEGNWKRKIISDDCNGYPSPVRYKDSIYLFYSQNTDITYPYRRLNMIKSDDIGNTWSKPRIIIDSEKLTKEKFDEVYQCGCELVKGIDSEGDKILITWSMWGGIKGHATEGKGAYYGELHIDDEMLYDGEGKLIGEYIDYNALINSCFIEEGDSNDITHTTFGPVATIDGDKKAIVIYGICKGDNYYLREAKQHSGIWQIKTIKKGLLYNVEDIRVIDDKIQIIICSGDTIVVYSKSITDNTWYEDSVTKIKHKNNSNSFPYCNFIDSGKKEVYIILGLIDRDGIQNYYNGLWPVNIIGYK